MEIWKSIDITEGWYECSNYGRVRSVDRIVNDKKLKGKVLKASPTTKGYLSLWISGPNYKKTQYPVHKLVAMTFLNHIPCGMKYIINHIDKNILNNTPENLEICDNRYNVLHSLDKTNCKSKFVGVSRNKSGNWICQVWYNKKTLHLGTYKTEFEAKNVYDKKVSELNANYKRI